MKRRKCTIVIKDEVNCAVMGLEDHHNEQLMKKYAMLVPQRFHMAAFKIGSWDGTIPFFHEAGSTYVNLLEEIIPFLEEYDYKIKLIDKRNTVVYAAEPIDENYFSDVEMFGAPLILRDHQVRVINALLENGGGIGKAATGAGKTFITAALTRIYEELDNLRVLTIVPNKTLVKQTYKDYIALGIDSGIYYGDRKETNHKHLVSTWQSLINKPHMMKDYDVVIVDEVHGAKGKSLQDLLIKYGSHIGYRCGVTGTMPKPELDQMSLRTALGDVVVDVPASELIGKNLLSNLDIDIIVLEHNLKTEFEQYKKDFRKSLTRPEPLTYTQFKDGYLPDWAAEKSYNTQFEDHMIWIAEFLEDVRNKDGNVLCLVDGVKHGKNLAKMIDNCYFLHGSDKVEAREEVYEQYATRDDMLTIATAQIASTGLNIKRIFAVVYINFGKSGIKVIQTVGRGLRTDDDKDFVKVYDISNDMKFARRHTAERIKFYKEEKYPHTKKIIKFAPKTTDLFD